MNILTKCKLIKKEKKSWDCTFNTQKVSYFWTMVIKFNFNRISTQKTPQMSNFSHYALVCYQQVSYPQVCYTYFVKHHSVLKSGFMQCCNIDWCGLSSTVNSVNYTKQCRVPGRQRPGPGPKVRQQAANIYEVCSFFH